MEVESDERVILTGIDRNTNSIEKNHNSAVNHAHFYSTENKDKHHIKKEEYLTSKIQRKYHTKARRKPEVKSSSSQGEIENMQIYRTDQPEGKDVFLPRLTGSSSRASPDNKSQDGGGQQLRLPEIRKVPNSYSRMALNKSITDLLDPEMEILNKIKFGPRKKKKKRHNNNTSQEGSTDVI